MPRRDQATQAKYLAYQQRLADQEISCQFCAPLDETEIVAELGGMLVLRNIFPYETWDGGPVADHLMIVSRTHAINLKDLSASEQADYLAACLLFEERGYNVYTRASSNPIRTVEHLHTHLIK